MFWNCRCQQQIKNLKPGVKKRQVKNVKKRNWDASKTGIYIKMIAVITKVISSKVFKKITIIILPSKNLSSSHEHLLWLL